MADTKISALGAAAALAGTEPFPTVQGGVTVQATAAQVRTYATSGNISPNSAVFIGAGVANDTTDGVFVGYVSPNSYIGSGANDGVLFGNGGRSAAGIPATIFGGWDTAGAFSTAGKLTAGGGLAGVTTNGTASAGIVGELVTATASSVAITSGVAVNVVSISLTAGDWDVWGASSLVSPTTLTGLIASVSTTSSVSGSYLARIIYSPTASTSVSSYFVNPPNTPLQLASTTTVYLVMVSTHTGTATASGTIFARRIR
jgi:hypothetical protein